MLLAVSRVNESVPLFLVEGAKARLGSLAGRKVAVLGLSFKRDSDDERDSLAPKLVRLLERELAEVHICDPHAHSLTEPLEEAVRDAEAVFVATNHSDFETPEARAAILQLSAPGCLLADPWNSLGDGQVFSYPAEVGPAADADLEQPVADPS
jgi:UDP-N-acetyl-D-mannosaminuronic acid dehydrogenase